MESGIVSLKPLYEYVKSEHRLNSEESKGMGPRLHDEGINFGIETKNLLLEIPDTVPGLFLLGRYTPFGQWEGMNLCRSAAIGKYTIEKVKKRRAFVYSCFYGKDILKSACENYFSEQCHNYWKEWKMAFTYAGSTYLVWITLPGFKARDIIAFMKELKAMGTAEGPIREDLIEPKTHAGQITLKFKEAIDSVRSGDRFIPDSNWYSD